VRVRPEDTWHYLSNKYPVAALKDVQKKLSEPMQHWAQATHHKLKMRNPFFQNQRLLSACQRGFKSKQFTCADLEADYQGYTDFANLHNTSIDTTFWEQELHRLQTLPSTKNIKLARKLLLKNWEKSLNLAYTNWELMEVERCRENLLQELEEWLIPLQQCQDALASFSEATGFLFDLSHGDITLADINQLKKWAEYIQNNEEIKALCDMLGRLRTHEQSTHQEVMQRITHIEEPIKDYTSKEEIIGIKTSNELDRVLPQELALLRDPETAILFDKKFVESQLMCFELEGTAPLSHPQEEEVMEQIRVEDKPGPMIICVDTSGSMAGSPELIAKAISLYLASRAKTQHRECLLINFSTAIETLELSGTLGLNQLITFLGRSFRGGTDIAPALHHAIQNMNDHAYRKADVLLVSDFVMRTLPTELTQSIQAAQKNKNKFYSLSIGNLSSNHRITTHFDGQWIYNPATTSIKPLHALANAMDRGNNVPDEFV
jgi:uncharacterized protein with von Willebrand factor type A (vWA) domain